MVAMAPVTYPQKYIGISRNLSTHQGLLEAAGWHCFRIRSRIGTGKAAFETACGRLMAWEMQRHAGLRPLIDDHTVTLHLGPIKHRCFIVHAEQTAESACVSYGTMPGHWESGEESFRVWMEADAVWAECAAFSRPQSWVTKIGGPVARLGQRIMARRYLGALVTSD